MPELTSEIAGSLVPLTKQQAMVMVEAGHLWMELRNFDAARELFAGAVALMPKSHVPQLALGLLEFNLGHFDKALQSFRTAQRLLPKAALPRAHCAEALLFMGKLGEADKELAAALSAEDEEGRGFAEALRDDKAAILMAAGQRAAAQGEWPKARDLFRASAKETPMAPEPLLSLGEVELATKNLGAAKEHFEAAQKLAPKDWVPVGRLAMVAFAAGDAEAGRKHAKAARAMISKDDVDTRKALDAMLA